MSSLFTPLQVGALTLPNRVLMAPLTRCRAEGANVPTDLMAVTRHQRMSLPSASIIDPVIGPFRVAGGSQSAICTLSSIQSSMQSSTQPSIQSSTLPLPNR